MVISNLQKDGRKKSDKLLLVDIEIHLLLRKGENT